jgi:glutamate:GABA antiporter
VFLGQAGTSVKGAYDVLVSMTVITTFLPFLYLFAAMFKLQREPTGPEVMCVPGGRTVARIVAVLGFCTTMATIVVSLLPPSDEPNKALAVIKVVGLTTLLMGIGMLLHWSGKRRAKRELAAALPPLSPVAPVVSGL